MEAKKTKIEDWIEFFPHKEPRVGQIEIINFVLDSFFQNKKFAIVEAGTGVGKSAIGITVARYLNSLTNPSIDEFDKGCHILTTQKSLQDQYLRDFGKEGLRSIKSSSNYPCRNKKGLSCKEGQNLLRGADRGSSFFKNCTSRCLYKEEKENYIKSLEGVTNFPYFLTESNFSGKLTPRHLLIVDEAHNVESELSSFIQVSVSENFAKSILKLNMPDIRTQHQAITWIRETYLPRLKIHVDHVEDILESYKGLKDRLASIPDISRQLEMLMGHYARITKMVAIYNPENWVMDLQETDVKKSRRLEFKPIDVSPYAESLLFSRGKNVILMSATILDKDSFCESLGVSTDDASFISISTPFPLENRPIFYVPSGKMGARDIDTTLPNLALVVSEIIDQHSDEKGIIHCHTFKIANYLKNNIRSSRLMIHNSDNREKIIQKYIKSKKPVVLISPSSTEGLDLKGDLSRFQIICKIPFPYLGDKLTKKRMNRYKWWYPYQTAKKIVQSVGRSIRSDKDYAVSYILDSNWRMFYERNEIFFPKSFQDALQE